MNPSKWVIYPVDGASEVLLPGHVARARLCRLSGERIPAIFADIVAATKSDTVLSSTLDQRFFVRRHMPIGPDTPHTLLRVVCEVPGIEEGMALIEIWYATREEGKNGQT